MNYRRGLALEVLLEVAHDVVVVTAAGEDVDEAEQLRLERAPSHGPVEELLAPPRAPEQAALLLAAGLGDPAGQRLDFSLGGYVHPVRRVPPHPASTVGPNARIGTRGIVVGGFLTGNFPG